MNKTVKKIAIGVSIPLISGIILLIVGYLFQDIRKKPTEIVEKESNVLVHPEIITGDESINSIGDNNTINVDKSTQIITQNFFPENPVPPKIAPVEESLTIHITEENAGSGSAFGGDVLIQMNTILDRPDYAAVGIITIKSTGKHEQYNYMGLTSPPLVIGDYKIDVVDIARNYAKFRVIKGKT